MRCATDIMNDASCLRRFKSSREGGSERSCDHSVRYNRDSIPRALIDKNQGRNASSRGEREPLDHSVRLSVIETPRRLPVRGGGER